MKAIAFGMELWYSSLPEGGLEAYDSADGSVVMTAIPTGASTAVGVEYRVTGNGIYELRIADNAHGAMNKSIEGWRK